MSLYSIIIPARNEAESLAANLEMVCETLSRGGLEFEIIVVDDHSSDRTAEVVRRFGDQRSEVRLVVNDRHPPGFGYAVRTGLDVYRGDVAVVFMADGSDSAKDILAYSEKMAEGYDCVFGSRFIRGGSVSGYPLHKLLLNRVANRFIQFLFRLALNDTTNAFKCYSREVIDGIQPLISNHFNLTVEMPLKALARGYSCAIVPIQWAGREVGVSKLRIKEMGSRYLFIVLYVWLEKHLSRGDYQRARKCSRDGDVRDAGSRATGSR